MKRIPFFIMDVFTDTPFQGNPAGVFLDDSATLTEDDMRRLAGEIHLESAFVLPPYPDDAGLADYRLRYFTGVTEVPLCGHDTVATGTVLQRVGRVRAGQQIRFATQVGILPVIVEDSGDVTMLQNPPQFDLQGMPAAIDEAEILAALHLPVGARNDSLPIRRVSTGTPWLFVPLRSHANVDRTPADFAGIAAVSRRYGTYGIYTFTVESGSEDDGVAVWSRCYAPDAGLNEDPVTGSASGALGGYLADAGVLRVPAGGSATITARQGFAGGRGGTVRVIVSREADGAYGRISVTGRARVLAEGEFTL